MQIKDFKMLARKILDTHGYQDVAIRFGHSVNAGAWVLFKRSDGPKLFARDPRTGFNVHYYSPDMNEYPSMTFSLEFLRHKDMDMDTTLRFLYHELAHLKRGVDFSKGPHYTVERFKEEQDGVHDYLWMKEMWKLGYEGKPIFNKKDQELNNKVLTEAGFINKGGKDWEPPMEGKWRGGFYRGVRI